MSNLTLNIKNDIARINFDLIDEKVNKLSFFIFKEFDNLLEEVKNNKKIKALLITSSKKDIFIAGADIKEIEAFKSKEEVYIALLKAHAVLNKLENLKIPTISYINGACLGGGLELALACKYRVASTNKKTVFAFPEIKLGVFPGLAACVRAPLLIGLVNSLDLILSAKQIDSKKAKKISLVDEIFDHAQKDYKLNSFIKKILKKEIKRDIPFINKISFLRDIVYNKAKQNLQKKLNKDYKAPFIALEVIKQTFKKQSFQDSIKIEAEAFSKLAVTQESKNLINLFFTFEKLNKNIYKSDNKITKVFVSGSGVMAGGIIWLFSKYLLDIRVKLRDLSNFPKLLQNINKIYDYLIKTKKISKNSVDFNLNKISYTNKFDGLKGMDLALEAIIEDEKIKKETFLNIQKANKNIIIATNTSSLSIEKLSTYVKNKENFIGIHFFNPVNLMPLVEVIPNSQTSQKTINLVFDFLLSCKKTPILVNDCAGFLVNRILLPYLNEAAFILEKSSSVEEIDNILKDFGMPMGPFTLADTVGIDIGYKVSCILNKAYGNRMPLCSLIKKLHSENLLGKKTKIGFYDYSSKKVIPNHLISLYTEKKEQISSKDILSRCLFIMINEASRCLEENIVKDANIIDFAMIAGTGFPAYRGGILSYANEIGISYIYEKLLEYETLYGERFKASKLLEKLYLEKKDFNTGGKLWKL